MKVFGDRAVNNNISICCRSLVGTTFNEACTTLIILYGILSKKISKFNVKFKYENFNI